jgi:hypothetical protein
VARIEENKSAYWLLREELKTSGSLKGFGMNERIISLVGRKERLSVKIQGDSYSFDIAESDYDNQIALSPTNVKGKGDKLKKYAYSKK